MLGVLVYILYLSVPLISLTFFIVSLCLFLSAKKKNKITPGIFTASQLVIRKALLIVSSVILFVVLTIIIALIALFAMAIAYM